MTMPLSRRQMLMALQSTVPRLRQQASNVRREEHVQGRTPAGIRQPQRWRRFSGSLVAARSWPPGIGRIVHASCLQRCGHARTQGNKKACDRSQAFLLNAWRPKLDSNQRPPD